jgi:hypothetical protein
MIPKVKCAKSCCRNYRNLRPRILWISRQGIKDLNTHYSACQAFGIVRRRGTALAMFIEDHGCFEPIIAYGLLEPLKDFLEGSGSAFFVENAVPVKEPYPILSVPPHSDLRCASETLRIERGWLVYVSGADKSDGPTTRTFIRTIASLTALL